MTSTRRIGTARALVGSLLVALIAVGLFPAGQAIAGGAGRFAGG